MILRVRARHLLGVVAWLGVVAAMPPETTSQGEFTKTMEWSEEGPITTPGLSLHRSTLSLDQHRVLTLTTPTTSKAQVTTGAARRSFESSAYSNLKTLTGLEAKLKAEQDFGHPYPLDGLEITESPDTRRSTIISVSTEVEDILSSIEPKKNVVKEDGSEFKRRIGQGRSSESPWIPIVNGKRVSPGYTMTTTSSRSTEFSIPPTATAWSLAGLRTTGSSFSRTSSPRPPSTVGSVRPVVAWSKRLVKTTLSPSTEAPVTPLLSDFLTKLAPELTTVVVEEKPSSSSTSSDGMFSWSTEAATLPKASSRPYTPSTTPMPSTTSTTEQPVPLDNVILGSKLKNVAVLEAALKNKTQTPVTSTVTVPTSSMHSVEWESESKEGSLEEVPMNPVQGLVTESLALVNTTDHDLKKDSNEVLPRPSLPTFGAQFNNTEDLEKVGNDILLGDTTRTLNATTEKPTSQHPLDINQETQDFPKVEKVNKLPEAHDEVIKIFSTSTTTSTTSTPKPTKETFGLPPETVEINKIKPSVPKEPSDPVFPPSGVEINQVKPVPPSPHIEPEVPPPPPKNTVEDTNNIKPVGPIEIDSIPLSDIFTPGTSGPTSSTPNPKPSQESSTLSSTSTKVLSSSETNDNSSTPVPDLSEPVESGESFEISSESPILTGTTIDNKSGEVTSPKFIDATTETPKPTKLMTNLVLNATSTPTEESATSSGSSTNSSHTYLPGFRYDTENQTETTSILFKETDEMENFDELFGTKNKTNSVGFSDDDGEGRLEEDGENFSNHSSSEEVGGTSTTMAGETVFDSSMPSYVRISIKGSPRDVCLIRDQLKDDIMKLFPVGLVNSNQLILSEMDCSEETSKIIPLQLYLIDNQGDYDPTLNEKLWEVVNNHWAVLWRSNHYIYPIKLERVADIPMTSDTTSTPGGDSGSSSTLIAAIIISSVAAVSICALILLLVIMRKRQAGFTYGQRCTPVSLEDYSLDNISVYNSMRRKPNRASKRSYGNPAFDDPNGPTRPLNFAGLSTFASSRSQIEEEFGNLPVVTVKADELPPGAESKNRYANVIPLPETRVMLKAKGNSSDPVQQFINANYVKGMKGAEKFYIACQAPMQSSISDFWQMIWEQQSRLILMLTDLSENGAEKCADYLPPSEVLDCHRLFGDLQVTLKKREVREKYIISSLQLKNLETNLWREVTHLWYVGWPVSGVPQDPASLIAFLIEARSYIKTKETSSPIVVHCSPGTGRTGTVIAIDIGIRQFETERSVDVPKTVYGIRRDRAGAVQTKDQYAFIYKTLHLYATKLTGGGLDSI